ncbi:MAG: InlB B-repeat-containing protein [Atopobiaceae bacterium]|nr:InlB B-repeat-containing protein [Atopobiaceae bacterium]
MTDSPKIVYYKITAEGYNDKTGSAVVTINKVASSAATDPTATNPTYTGTSQDLVNAGSATGGTMQYSLDGTSFSESIPQGIEPGEYTVHYKVVGDANHTDTEVATVTSTIKAQPTPVKATYAVIKGDGSTWTKGSKSGLALTFKRTAEGETTDTTFSHFVSASVDGTQITKGDDYTAAEGSVVVTLTPSYLNTLVTGKHTLTATFDDGSATASFTVAEAVTNTVTFTFDANGGTGTMDPMVVEKGKTVKLTRNAFTRPGYSFAGWNLKADGSGQDYEDEQSVIASFDGTLYAQWEKGGYPAPTMSNSRGGNITSTSDEITFTISQEVPDYAYKFRTWVDLENVLTFSSNEVTVKTSDGESVGSDVAKVTIDGQRLTVTVSDATSLHGKTLQISYKAKVKSGANLSPYANAAGNIASVPYRARTVFDNDEDNVKSSTVEYVKFRVGTSSNTTRTSTTSLTRATTLAKTGDPTSLMGVAVTAMAGAGAVLAGWRRRK